MVYFPAECVVQGSNQGVPCHIFICWFLSKTCPIIRVNKQEKKNNIFHFSLFFLPYVLNNTMKINHLLFLMFPSAPITITIHNPVKSHFHTWHMRPRFCPDCIIRTIWPAKYTEPWYSWELGVYSPVDHMVQGIESEGSNPACIYFLISFKSFKVLLVGQVQSAF